MIHTGIYDGHTPGPWKVDDRIKEMFLGLEPDVMLMQDAPLLLEEVKRLHKNKSNLFTTIEQKLNEKGDEGEAIWEAYPDGHYKEDQLRGWCEALEFVLSLMKAQEREE